MKTRFTIVVALALLVGLAVGAEAQRGVRGSRRGIALTARGLGAIMLNDTALNRFADRIQLTEEQQNELQAIAQSYRADNAETLNRLNGMRAELRALRDSADRPTRDALDEIVERYEHPDLDMARAERELGRDLRALLTPDQERRLARGIRGRAEGRMMVRPRRLPRRVVPLRRGMPGVRYAPSRRIRRIPRRP